MNYKNYFKQRLFEATFTFPGIFPFQANPDGQGLSPLPLQPPSNTNPIGPAPANIDPPNLHFPPEDMPPRPPPPGTGDGTDFGFWGFGQLPGSFGIQKIRMPDGTLRYEWIWIIPGHGILMWDPLNQEWQTVV